MKLTFKRIFLIALTLVLLTLLVFMRPSPSKQNFSENIVTEILAAKSPRLKEIFNDDSEFEKNLISLVPRIWWHSQEKYPASEPLDFLKNSEFYAWKANAYFPLYSASEKIFSRGETDPKVLAAKYGDPVLRPWEGSGIDQGYSGYYLKYLGGEKAANPNPPLFWRLSRHPGLKELQDKNPNSVILLVEFWYHSDMNPIPVYLGSHQGDWESFAYLVKFEILQQKIQTQILRAYLSAHRVGQWICPKDFEKDERINFYSALGTHATYSHAGIGNQGVLNDYMERGHAWETWNNLKPLEKQDYYGYSGAWGKVNLHWSMTGPMPPHPKFKGLPKENELPFVKPDCD